MPFPARAPVLDVPISVTSYDEVIDAIVTRPADRATVVAVCNVHSVMTARRDAALGTALRTAEVATPDGMPLVWALRRTVDAGQERVYGPELMERALRTPGVRHFLYGSTPATLARLVARIGELAPTAEVVGSIAPPFGELAPAEEAAHLDRIRASGADVVWVGLGMPKQELWMHRVRAALPGVALVGVGAAFDFLAGTKRQAPAWMRRSGLEWLFRLASEPRRLWRRYAVNNPLFLVLLARQLAASRRRG